MNFVKFMETTINVLNTPKWCGLTLLGSEARPSTVKFLSEDLIMWNKPEKSTINP